MDNLHIKYLKYKNKYNYLKNQYAGDFDTKTISQLTDSLFNKQQKDKFPDHFNLLKLIFEKLQFNKMNCNNLYDEHDLFKYFCHLEFKYLDPIPLKSKDIFSYYNKISKFKNIAKGAFGKVYSGKFNDKDLYTSIVKIPFGDSLNDDIIEAYINLCIINDIILNNIIKSKSINLIFTFGLFFVPYCDLEKTLVKDCDVHQKLSIQLIQQAIEPSKTLKEVLKAGVSLDLLILYFRQIFEQLIFGEESNYELIHNDLHVANILIQQNKIYIIDWGISSFKYELINEDLTILTKRIRSNHNKEDEYYINDKTGFSKTGLYDLYFLIKSCLFYNGDKNMEIHLFLKKILQEIFYNNKIYIYNKKSKKIIFLSLDHYNYGFWLYHIIGGYLNDENYNLIYLREIYDLNYEYFNICTYRKILDEINIIYDKHIKITLQNEYDLAVKNSEEKYKEAFDSDDEELYEEYQSLLRIKNKIKKKLDNL